MVLNLLLLMVDAAKLCQKENEELATNFEGLEDYDEEKKEEFQEDYNQNTEILQSKSGVLIHSNHHLWIVIREVDEILFKCFGSTLEGEVHNELIKVYHSLLIKQGASTTELQYSLDFFNSFFKSCSQDVNKISNYSDLN